MTLLEIHTFGGLNIYVDQEPLDGLKTRKAAALLVHVAVIGQSVERSHLADLLWHEFPEEKANANLRAAISDLRKNLPSSLLISRYQVQIHPEASLWLDTRELERNLSREYVDAALELYQGDFLGGFHLRNAAGFDEWQTFTREKYHLLVQENLHELIEKELSQGLYESGSLHAHRILELDPLDESAHRFEMQFLAARGQRTAAIRQYETCRQLLSDELGLDPDAETERLHEAIIAGDLETLHVGGLRAPARGVSTRAPGLPADLTRFVGREKEVEQTIDLITDSANRLVTIVGVGGMGKTRLSLEVGRRLDDRFDDGVHFVPLVSIEDPDAIPSQVAERLGLQLQPGVADQLQLINFLAPRELLLVLDNFEHLKAGTGLIKEMLQAAPKVKVLTTSREKLNIPGEASIYLKGMRYPASADSPDIDRFGSIRLFLQTALRAKPDFETNGSSVQAIVEVCQLVDGLPLGIELAAAWVDHLRVSEIVEELGKSSDLLASRTDASTDRHDSVRAVFDSTWERLSGAEQMSFAKLSVFKGGFTAQAAKEIAGAGLRVLSHLFDKSLLYPPKNGRYHIHELLRQFAAEKLAAWPEEERATRDLHSRYFAELIHEHGYKPAYAISELILPDMDNVRSAWRSAVLANQFSDMERMIGGFGLLLERKGWLNEGVSAFALAEEHLANRKLTIESKPVYGMVLMQYGYFLFRAGEELKGAELVRKAYEILCQLDLEEECAWARLWMVNFDSSYGRDEGEEELRKSLATFEKLNLTRAARKARENLAIHARSWGSYDEAGRLFQDNYREFTKDQDVLGAAFSVFGLGDLADREGDYLLARHRYEEAISLFHEGGHVTMTGVVKKYLGHVHLVQNDYDHADAYFLEYLELNQETGIGWRVADAHECLARVSMARVDLDTARLHLDKSKAVAAAAGHLGTRGYTSSFLGYWASLKEDHKLAGQHFLNALQASGRETGRVNLGLLVMALSVRLLAELGELARATEMASLSLGDPRKAAPAVQHEARRAVEYLQKKFPETEFAIAGAQESIERYERAKLALAEILAEISK